MTDTPDSTVTAPESVPVANTDGRQRPNRLYQSLAWVGIIAGVLLIVGMVFFAGVFLGRTGGYGWHRGYHNGQMGPGGPMNECPMMRGGGMGHNAWVTHSEIAVAEGPSPFGPFTFKTVALPARGKGFWDGLCTHNPTIQRFGKKYYLYYMGNTGDGVAMKTLNWTHRNNQRVGVAVADHPLGPWKRFDQPIVAPDKGFYDALCCTNPSVTRRPDGGFLMVYKAVGDSNPLPFGGPVLHCVATSKSPVGPFVKHPDPVFVKKGVAFAAEDPFIWFDGRIYRAVVKDNNGYFTNAGKSLALFESMDGFDWKLSAHPLVSTMEVKWANGKREVLNSLERPQLWFEKGKPAVLLCAADVSPAREFSFNLQIPIRT